MFYTLSWLFVLSLLALWSLGAWALHAITLWSTSNVGALSGHAKAVEDLDLPGWLATWLPVEWVAAFKSMVAAMVPMLESVLALAPGLGGGLSVLVGVLWGVGGVLLLLLGAALHAVIAMLSRRTGGQVATR